jgi:hypothetical protein
MDCFRCFDALLLSLSLSLSLSRSAIFLFGLCERVVLEYVRQARTACVAVGATHLSFADAIKLHNTVTLRLLSLSVSDFIVADPFLARNLERCAPADWRRTTAADDSLLDHFSEDEARTKQNQKKAAENFLSLTTFGMGIRSSISPDASAIQTKRQERNLFSRSTL